MLIVLLVVTCFLRCIEGTTYSLPTYSSTYTYPLNTSECYKPKSLGGKGFCGPAYCESYTTTLPACTFTQATMDYPTEVLSQGCRVCTQSTDSRCTSSGILSRIKTDGGILAMFCNDNYLVTYSSGYVHHTYTHISILSFFLSNS